MKKVRFESPKKHNFRRMDELECHSPRPFVERQAPAQPPEIYEPKRVVYSSDPLHRFEYSDSSPYPLAKKTLVPSASLARPDFLPSNDLNLSMLDVHEPRQPCKPVFNTMENISQSRERISLQPNVLSPIENTPSPPNVLKKDDNFFIRRDNLKKYNFDINPMQKDISRLTLEKENHPLAKPELPRMAPNNTPFLPEKNYPQQVFQNPVLNNDCNCHHCIRPTNVPQCTAPKPYASMIPVKPALKTTMPSCPYQPQLMTCFNCETHSQRVLQVCHCTETLSQTTSPKNTVDKKRWALEKLEQSKKTECMEVEKQTNVTKEKREPTISDLLRIIKLQNEQLQLLQEKVDKFISTSSNQNQIPIQNYRTEHVALQTIDSGHKISIGVMTSFEMVRTSTVFNKEIVKQNENAHIQCNRSQISIKEVVSSQPKNSNFLDGITPVDQTNAPPDLDVAKSFQGNDTTSRNQPSQQTGNICEEKTFNEMSLYNVQVDNATTPLMSPDQSLYLDVRDYSNSSSTSSVDQSNVGWTYYNKVMTHVNGLLEDSEMPSSASALFRNTRQQCVQMQIDKTNVSVTKRVKFGDDPIGVHQPHIYAGATDTSLIMNQLAAKYLKNVPAAPQRIARPTANLNPVDVSFATRNYMERHKILQGLPVPSRSPAADDLPRFLDITALKQQPKLL